MIPEQDLPAAAAGSLGDFTEGEPEPAFSCLSGLRLRCLSWVLEAGERERRSNREGRFASGSFWSKRERLADLGWSSAMIRSLTRIYEVERVERSSFRRLNKATKVEGRFINL